jgi:hypothetical protein
MPEIHLQICVHLLKKVSSKIPCANKRKKLDFFAVILLIQPPFDWKYVNYTQIYYA